MWNKETLYTQIFMHWVWLLGQIGECVALFHKYCCIEITVSIKTPNFL